MINRRREWLFGQPKGMEEPQDVCFMHKTSARRINMAPMAVIMLVMRSSDIQVCVISASEVCMEYSFGRYAFAGCLQEAALVAPTDAMDRMQELLRKAEAAVLALSEAVAERDRAICEKDAFIARISGQLAELRALQDQ
jgi:hypothetical protein